WTSSVRGDIHHLKSLRGASGNEQSGARFAVVLQSDDLPLSTLLVAPTSTSARPRSFRPTITVGSATTQVLVEQTAAVDPGRLGTLVGHLSRGELDQVDQALRMAFELD
ncbi:MAG: type II toxin-antitoxin system PemK/MazF family toxin, partial [Rhodoglobus sp.]|nr:type II toxin-antitoxin system PemK/MazF family toxin [Rhodoglobus sp.]